MRVRRSSSSTICALIDDGALDAAERRARQMGQVAAERDDPFAAPRAEYCTGRVLLARGRPTSAARLFRRCSSALTPFDLTIRRHLHSMLARSEAMAGRADAVTGGPGRRRPRRTCRRTNRIGAWPRRHCPPRGSTSLRPPTRPRTSRCRCRPLAVDYRDVRRALCARLSRCPFRAPRAPSRGRAHRQHYLTEPGRARRGPGRTLLSRTLCHRSPIRAHRPSRTGVEARVRGRSCPRRPR